jgi:hypothetical protein
MELGNYRLTSARNSVGGFGRSNRFTYSG